MEYYTKLIYDLERALNEFIRIDTAEKSTEVKQLRHRATNIITGLLDSVYRLAATKEDAIDEVLTLVIMARDRMLDIERQLGGGQKLIGEIVDVNEWFSKITPKPEKKIPNYDWLKPCSYEIPASEKYCKLGDMQGVVHTYFMGEHMIEMVIESPFTGRVFTINMQ